MQVELQKVRRAGGGVPKAVCPHLRSQRIACVLRERLLGKVVAGLQPIACRQVSLPQLVQVMVLAHR